jgi:hypothetical protein
MDELIKPVLTNFKVDENGDPLQNSELEFLGSDDDIRCRFEFYLSKLFSSINAEEMATKSDSNPI